MRTTKNKPSEKIGEDNTQYEFRCHQCGGDFMAAGIFIDGFASSSILLLNRKNVRVVEAKESRLFFSKMV